MVSEKYITYVLKTGLMLSAALIIIGLIMIAYSEGMSNASIYSYSLSMNTSKVSLNALVSGISSGNGVYYMITGIMILIATPLALVLFTVLYFAIQKDLLYTVITLIVATNLLVAIFVIPHFI